MSVGIGQILVVVLVFLLLFGNFPKVRKDLSAGGVAAIRTFQNGLSSLKTDGKESIDLKEKEKEKSDSKLDQKIRCGVRGVFVPKKFLIRFLGTCLFYSIYSIY